MKTKNNVQKAILKSLAIATGLVLLSNAISGQDLWRSAYENNETNDVAIALASGTSAPVVKLANAGTSNAYSSFSALTATEAESALEIESWMTDAAYFTNSVYLELETEAPLNLENWMTSENYFEMNTLIETEQEDALEVEDWMLNEKVFEPAVKSEQKNVVESNDSNADEKKVIKTKTFVFTNLEDPELNFEAWMFNTHHWETR